MKKFVSLLLCLVMAFSVFACVDDGDKDGDGDVVVNPPSVSEVLAIAKKYYDDRSQALDQKFKSEFASEVSSVTFDGKAKDEQRAEVLCNQAAIMGTMQYDGNYAVGCAAAAVGWSVSYARAADVLAAVLEKAGFITDSKRLEDALALAKYAVSLDNKNADFYITLAQIRCDLKDNDGALKAVDEALKIEPNSPNALELKLLLIVQKGGSGMEAEAKKVGDKLKENEGELSKRDKKQENDAEGQTAAKSGDSKDSCKKKLEELAKLEVITPADMVEALFPAEAKQLRQKIVAVTPEQKNLNFPEFPHGLFKSAKHIKVDAEDAVRSYLEWCNDYLNNIMYNELPKLANEALEAAMKHKARPYDGTTAVDYMLKYNQQVCTAATGAYIYYNDKLLEEHQNELVNFITVLTDKLTSTTASWAAELEAIGNISDPEVRNAKREECDKRYKNIVNGHSEDYVQSILSRTFDTYSDMTDMAQEVWDNVVPYIRCTDFPENMLYSAYSILVPVPLSILYAGLSGCTTAPYYEEVVYADVIAAQEALEEVIRLCNTKFVSPSSALQGITLSVSFGPFEFKLSANKVEAEYVNGVAGRVSFDWKSNQLEVGAGAGVTGKAGFLDLQGKVYANVVIDLRSGEVTDVYLSAEAKGGAKGFEAGGQAKISLMGGGVGLSTAAKQTVGKYGIEHETEIIK